MFIFALLPHSCISEKCHRGIIDVYLIVFIIAMQLHNGDILELNIMTKQKCLGWRLIFQIGSNFISKSGQFEGNRMNYGFCINLYTII